MDMVNPEDAHMSKRIEYEVINDRIREELKSGSSGTLQY